LKNTGEHNNESIASKDGYSKWFLLAEEVFCTLRCEKECDRIIA
jgi:hypothetical protein